jgi:hypothetical protein
MAQALAVAVARRGQDLPTEAAETLRALLDELADTRVRLDRVEHLTVALLRATGASWEAIGEAIGISRQAARQRFGIPRRRR